MSLFIPLADAVKNLLNGNTFSQSFIAARIYDAFRPLETQETLRVDVVLGDRKSEPLDRTRQKETIRVEIAIRQVVSQAAGSDAEKAELDALVGLMEEIDAYMSSQANRRPPLADWAAWQVSELVYPFLPKHLREARQFVSLLRLTYLAATS